MANNTIIHHIFTSFIIILSSSRRIVIMYFKPSSQKTYYRFPASNRITDSDIRFYFPEKPEQFEEDANFNTRLTNQISEKETPGPSNEQMNYK